MAEFISECISMKKIEEEKDSAETEEEEKEWSLTVDGASNQFGSGVGVILSRQDVKLEYCIRLGFEATNNAAEYEALILGLKLAKAIGVKVVKVKSDSQLIVK